MLLVVCALQVVGAVAGLVFGEPAAARVAFEGLIPPRAIHMLILTALATAGAALLVTGRNDRRAAHLGTFFLLLATPFTNRWLLVLVTSAPRALAELPLVLRSLHVDSFFPYFFWLFARDFPRTNASYRMRRWLRWGTRGTLALGIALFAWQLVRLARALGGTGAVAPAKPSYEHYIPLMVATILGLFTLFWKARKATGSERRRAVLFAAAIALALLPVFLHIVAFLAPPLKQFLAPEAVGPVRAAFVLLCFLSLPFTTAYAVLVHKVLNVKLLARRAVQYALARGTALVVIFLPLAALLVYFYLHSEEPLRESLTGNRRLLVLCSLAGVAALLYGARILVAIDRRFFREQFDARRILTQLVDRIFGLRGAELAALICREVDRALHLVACSLLVEEPRTAHYVDPLDRKRKLDAFSPLGLLVAESVEPLEIDLEEPAAAASHLPEADRRWLAENRVRLIAPIPARDGTLLGAIVLGAKKSGLPFLKEDKHLLRDIAHSAAMGLKRPDPPPAGPQPPASENARECPACGRVFLPHTVFCSEDSRRLEPAHVPYVLPPKFRFDRRIGVGGMGVVYRACDLSLGRAVAIKTVRRVSPDDARRLRAEAHAAAKVVHPHLAGIYGVDTWQETPMLILELLEGGTLGQRIEQGGLTPVETVELGIAMAAALAEIHAADILHRDVKPNNIGFTKDGVPKLMDFGIARTTLDTRTDDTSSAEWPEVPEDPTLIGGEPDSLATPSRQLVGTLSYLSPEALAKEPASPSFDLWGLCVVLYECLIGRKLFRGENANQVMAKILLGRVPELTDALPDAPEPLARFFRAALHRDSNRRPADAAALRARLMAVRSELA